MDLELDIVEALEQLYKDFDNNYIALVEQNKINYNTYFTQLHDLEAWFEAVTGQAMQHLEQYQAEELEDLGDTRTLLQDKEMLLNWVQSSHDAHTSKIDSLEDKLVTNEEELRHDDEDRGWISRTARGSARSATCASARRPRSRKPSRSTPSIN